MSRIGPVNRSPIRGAGGIVTTPGVPQTSELRAASTAHRVSQRDLDLFLQARQKQKAGKQGLLGWLKSLVGSSKPDVNTARKAQEIKQNVSRTLEELGQIYADGVVDEHELVALSHARDRIGKVLQLADPSVLDMLPRDVRNRLENQLFSPLEIIHGAAYRRSKRVWDQVEARDKDVLTKRLAEPVELRTLDVNVFVRSGLEPTAISRYVPGDFICVPRSDGTSSMGVVVANFGDRVDVEFLDHGGALSKKSLDADGVASANPVKIGDSFRAGHQMVTVRGVTRQGLVGTIDGRPANAAELKAAVRDAFKVHANQSMLVDGVFNVPGFFHLGPALQRKVTALFNLRGDPCFDRMCDELRATTRSREFLAQPPEQQAQKMISLLHRSELLHSGVPSFGVVRANVAGVTYGNAHWDDGNKHFRTAGPTPRAVVQQLSMQIGPVTRAFDVVFPESWPIEKQRASMAELAQTLMTLPPEALTSVERIVMNPEANPSDKYWEQAYNIPDFQSAMTADGSSRSITVYPCTSVASGLQKFTHEVGHLVSIDAFGSIDGSTPGWDMWKQASKNDVVTCSQYAQKSPAEDFAETFALYTTTKGTARHDEYRGLMPHRFAILDEIARQAEHV